MEQWKKNRTRATWSLAWLFALLFHQLLPILFGIAFNSQTFIVITIYFGIITFLFTWMFLLSPIEALNKLFEWKNRFSQGKTDKN